MSEYEKPTPEELRAAEPDLLRGLLEAASYRDDPDERVQISIARKGKLLFRFRIRPLSEDEYNDCRDRATEYQPHPRMGGIKMPAGTDAAKYRSLLIYTATVPEDRQALWDNREAWKQLNVLSGWQMIDRVLLAGEKEAVLAKLDAISGYGADLEEMAKN